MSSNLGNRHITSSTTASITEQSKWRCVDGGRRVPRRKGGQRSCLKYRTEWRCCRSSFALLIMIKDDGAVVWLLLWRHYTARRDLATLRQLNRRYSKLKIPSFSTVLAEGRSSPSYERSDKVDRSLIYKIKGGQNIIHIIVHGDD